MSTFEYQPPPTPAPQQGPGEPVVPTWLLLLLVLLVIVGTAAVGVELWKRYGPEQDDGPPHPSSWDPKVAPYVKIAEDLRGLNFVEPVYVDFQEPEEFEKALSTDKSELDEEDLEEIEQFTGLFRAMGLVQGELDLFDEINKLSSGGTLAYYSLEEERIRVRGTRLTPAVRSTLIHELVHVLQDQHFDIGARSKALADQENSAGLAFDALIEGDARRIETAWSESLSPKQQQALRRDEQRQQTAAAASLKDVPEVLRIMIAAPYELGEALLRVATLQGKGEVNALFRNPPTTEEHLIDPFTLLDDEDEPVRVDEPALEDGQEEFDTNTFEAMGWLLTLAARIPLTEALTAVDGWGGDRFVAYTENDRSCVQIRYVGDTRRDTAEMVAALRRWVDRGPAGAASIRREGADGLLFTSCDPGTRTRGFGENSRDALALALTRTYVSVNLLEELKGVRGVPHRRALARCYGTTVAERYSVAELQASGIPGAEQNAMARECTKR